MLIRYWQPWREVETLRRQLDQVFDELTQPSQRDSIDWTPAIELRDAGDRFVLRAQLPGMTAEDLDIQVGRDAVVLAGEHCAEPQTSEQGYVKSEFRYGKFRRVVNLPVAIENEQVQADYTNGLLSLTLPKVVEARNQVVKLNLTEMAGSIATETPAIAESAPEAEQN